MWIFQMSKGELVTSCFKNRYTLQVQNFTLDLIVTCNLLLKNSYSSSVGSVPTYTAHEARQKQSVTDYNICMRSIAGYKCCRAVVA